MTDRAKQFAAAADRTFGWLSRRVSAHPKRALAIFVVLLVLTAIYL
jgi:hypothetical protein